MADLSEYMTPKEFARLSSDAHHAVWQAHADRRIDAVPATASGRAGTLVYNRAQVLALVRETAVTRG